MAGHTILTGCPAHTNEPFKQKLIYDTSLAIHGRLLPNNRTANIWCLYFIAVICCLYADAFPPFLLTAVDPRTCEAGWVEGRQARAGGAVLAEVDLSS